MFVDDGSWASKPGIKDRAQGTALDFIAMIKTAHDDTEISETLSETSKQFSALDGTMRTTRQNIIKMAHVLRQVQDANFGVLDNLRATDQATKSLRIDPSSTWE